MFSRNSIFARNDLCAQVEPGSEESSKFARLINGNSETKLAWPRKLQLSPMAPAEFVTILATLLRRNLDAIFHESVNTREVTKTFYQWTQGNWWYITELVKVLDRVLGPTKKSGEPRVITEAVIETLRSTWVARTGRAQEAQTGEQEG